jgi:hypothetical protein
MASFVLHTGAPLGNQVQEDLVPLLVFVALVEELT